MADVGLSQIKVLVLVILCLQNSLFTVLRRYSQGILKEDYSKHEVLLFGEVVKVLFSAYMISKQSEVTERKKSVKVHITHLLRTAKKMFALSLIYGCMNILSFVALRNISAGMFTICAQLKILTTATCSSIMLKRKYSSVKWRALLFLILGVLLFSEPIWNSPETFQINGEGTNFLLGISAVLTEVTLSGFASIYFEKVIKNDPEKLNIWERNFQLAFGSFPIYLCFIFADGGGSSGYFGGWSVITVILALLGAAGGLLVALSIKYGDAILKTLATTGAIILSSLLDNLLLDGPLNLAMILAGGIVVNAIFDYTFDPTPPEHYRSLSEKDDVNDQKAKDEKA